MALIADRTALFKVIEREIIPRLLVAHRSIAQPTAVEAVAKRQDRAVVDSLAALALRGDSDAFFAEVLALQGLGMSADTVLLDVFAPAARRLGCLWDKGGCTFTEVTTGLSLLHRAVDAVRAHTVDASREPAPGHRGAASDARILLALAPGEQHFFGLRLVAEIMERGGWRVRYEPTLSQAEIVAVARAEATPFVGLSISCHRTLPALQQTILQLRTEVPGAGPRVIVGGGLVVQEPDLAADLGADACAVDARSALDVANSFLDTPLRRC